MSDLRSHSANPQAPGHYKSSRRVFISGSAAAIFGLQTLTGPTSAAGLVAAADRQWGDAVITFRTRAPVDAQEVQLWCAFRCQGPHSRYVVALRGGNNNDMYIARYAPEGGIRFLGIAPLNFKPVAGEWYQLRIVAMGAHFHVYLNNEALPRLNARDPQPLWAQGTVYTGGGWLPAEYEALQITALSEADHAAFTGIGDKIWTPPSPDKTALRQSRRAAYQPVKLTALGSHRTEVPLDGKWLFMPEYELATQSRPVELTTDDSAWHVMDVPDFWTPGMSWLYGQTSFPYLKGVSRLAGVAESLDVQEARRVEGYTFDWNRTKAAWYRHYIELPGDLTNRQFSLAFDAIAKMSEIWVNGIKVGGHTGLFAEIRCDITAAMRPGRNVIAVYVVSEIKGHQKASPGGDIVAVTVDVTPEMLNSLPHGMLQNNVGGIWQPVKLTVTTPVSVQDCFIQTSVHGASVTAKISNAWKHPVSVAVEYVIKNAADDSILYERNGNRPIKIELAAGTRHQLKFSTPTLAPKLWEPQSPNLYNLIIRIKSAQQILDQYTVRFGFRTFNRDGSQLLLNGKPYWLRGANPFPCNLKPNDVQLARRFTQMAHDGNIRAVRTHIIPFTAAWLNAADEIGMCVSYEGIWPWLMIQGNPPSGQLLRVWMQEYLSLIKKYRNHPSIIIWDVNNEMNFGSFDQNNPKLLKEKWIILDAMIRKIRRTDPTRPIVAYSGYTRKEAHKGYQEVVKPNGFDDGDIDDAHRYYGWYNPTFFHLYDGQFGDGSCTPGRPLISEEMGTGYPNNDDGHPTRHYLFNHYTPQALVGDDAYENKDPEIFLTRQAFMTKELGETLRRTGRANTAGIMHFAYFTWFKSPWSAKHISATPGYHAMKNVMQPVLVSAELFGRHFYAGAAIRPRVCIVNDVETFSAVPAGQLTWEILSGDQVLSRGNVSTPAVKYYANHWMTVEIKMPELHSSERVDGKLQLRLEANGVTISENHYDIVIAAPQWAYGILREKHANMFLIDSHHRSSNLLAGIAVTHIGSISAVRQGSLVIIGDPQHFAVQRDEVSAMRGFIGAGGTALLLHPGRILARLFPDQITGYVRKQGEIVTMRMKESRVFDGLEPLDLSWFEPGRRSVPIACTGVYHMAEGRADVIALAAQCDIHGYLKKPADIVHASGTPLVEIRIGKGRLLAVEMNLEAGKLDPIPQRLLTNMLAYLT